MKLYGRHFSIDLAKFVAAIFVIGIHTRPFQEISIICDFYWVELICRLAVPFFAVCTGYYLTNQYVFNNDKIIFDPYNKTILLQTFKKILLIYFSWSLFYLCIHLYDWYDNGILSFHYIIGWCKSLFFSCSYYHLWYFVALLYGLIWHYLILHYVRVKYLSIIILILWIIQVFCYCYYTLSPQFFKPLLFLNSFGSISISITRILPFLLIGTIISKQKIRISAKVSFVLFVISFLFLSVEVTWLHTNGITRFSYIFFTPSTAYFLFLFIVSIKTSYYDYSWMLAKMSMIVYCIHPSIIYFIKGYFSHITTFIITTTGAIIMSYLYISIKKCLFIPPKTVQ